METLVSREVLAEITRLKIEAALDATRLKRKMKNAVRLVLIESHTVSEAAKRQRVPRQYVHRAVKVARAKLAEVENYIAQS